MVEKEARKRKGRGCTEACSEDESEEYCETVGDRGNRGMGYSLDYVSDSWRPAASGWCQTAPVCGMRWVSADSFKRQRV